jgi:hypothetical protein
VLLSGDATFGLITAPTINDATDFDNGPGALWTAGLDDDTVDTVTITLAAVANKGAVDAAGTTSVSFAGANVGFVELLNVTGTSLSVYLDIDGGTLANFTSALTDVGINWSTTDLPAGYELVLTDLDPSTSGSAYFAWDLSKIDSSMTIQGVSIAIPEPTSAMLVGIGGLALCVRVRRRL